MSEDRAIEILKSALLLEKRGKAFYGKVASQAGSKPVADFFRLMAEEEDRHIRLLSEQFKSYLKNGRFLNRAEAGSEEFRTAAEVLGPEVRRQIAAAEFEAAAVAAAMGMEQAAVALYSRRAAEAVDPDEKSLYEWLARWESAHLEFLAQIDREVTESIWHDNRFWPF